MCRRSGGSRDADMFSTHILQTELSPSRRDAFQYLPFLHFKAGGRVSLPPSTHRTRKLYKVASDFLHKLIPSHSIYTRSIHTSQIAKLYLTPLSVTPEQKCSNENCGPDLGQFWFIRIALGCHVSVVWPAGCLDHANKSGSPKCHHSTTILLSGKTQLVLYPQRHRTSCSSHPRTTTCRTAAASRCPFKPWRRPQTLSLHTLHRFFFCCTDRRWSKVFSALVLCFRTPAPLRKWWAMCTVGCSLFENIIKPP